MRPQPGPLAEHWTLDPAVVYLNHGSFGAVPRQVQEAQTRWRAALEAEPVRFFIHHYPALLDRARHVLATELAADPEGLVFVANTTTGINTVLRSLQLAAGDEILLTDHEYNACRNAVATIAQERGARVKVVAIPFPIAGPEQVVTAVLDAIGRRTKVVLIDHVTSQTALVMPVQQLANELQERGVDLLVDGAHGPGMLELELDRLGAASYVGSCHKWLCAPRGAAFVYLREDRRRMVRPLVTSHGASEPEGRRSRLHLEFDWVGTNDPSPWLSVPDALAVVGGLLPGGWSGIRRANRELLLTARRRIAAALGAAPPCPSSMVASMASFVLPDHGQAAASAFTTDPLQDLLLQRYAIEVPVIPWPVAGHGRPQRPRRLLRLSAQLYNSIEQYDYLAAALSELLR